MSHSELSVHAITVSLGLEMYTCRSERYTHILLCLHLNKQHLLKNLQIAYNFFGYTTIVSEE